MEHICEPNKLFNFDDISLAHPTGIQGGAYFTKILQNNKPLYIEAPKCLTKQGFIKNGKKMYTDLMFNSGDEGFIHWIENLETKCQKLIYDKSEAWFQNKLEINDIESAFTSPLRVYKSGKFYLVRVNVKMNYSTNFPHVKIYNESETPLTIDDVNMDTQIISIIEVQGIKFTSRNFQIDLELKQAMVLNTDKIFDSCLIKTSSLARPTANTFEVSSIQTPPAPSKSENTFLKIEDNCLEEPTEIEERVEMKEPVEIEKPVIEETMNASASTPLSLLENLSDSILHSEKKAKSDIVISTSLLAKSVGQVDDIKEKSIVGSIVGLNIEELSQENSNELMEVDIDANLNNLETMTLKKPNQVYYEIYKEARNKAKKAKREAIVAFLEAKNIKKTYMLDDLDESDDSDDSDLDNISNESNSDHESDTEVENNGNY
uniref:Uncharacterized protein n=1 Tax=viral metagenome TaxID=1070528 RepID=A0A6C0ETS9_9ZZZZ